MGKPMDNMPFSEFYKWLASPPFTGPVGLIAKLYVKEVTTTQGKGSNEQKNNPPLTIVAPKCYK